MDGITLFDGHVHVHRQTDVAAMLSAAAQNFAAAAGQWGAAAWRGVLLLTEMAHRDWFAEVAAAPNTAKFGSWQIISSGADALNVRAVSSDTPAEITLVAGYQIITQERIEVLALGTRSRTADGAPLEATITAAQNADALVVLPWGAGKWLGARGRLVEQALAVERSQAIFAGDNRGRLSCLGEPAALAIARRRNLPVLPGTDPLALANEEKQVGAFGFALDGNSPATVSGHSLYELLSRQPPLGTYGRHVGPIGFIRNQAALRIKKERYP